MSNINKNIEGYKNYVIKSNGEVYSNVHSKTRKLKPQKASQSKKGYYQVRLFNEEFPKGRLQYIHRLVYEAFVGEITEGYEIDHIDDDTTNNNLDNIQLISRRGNMEKYLFGTYAINFRSIRDELIEDYKKLGTYKKVGEKWNTSEQVIYRTIKNVIHYKNYKTGKYETRAYDKNINDEYTGIDLRKKK
jgi:hypothetical protein